MWFRVWHCIRIYWNGSLLGELTDQQFPVLRYLFSSVFPGSHGKVDNENRGKKKEKQLTVELTLNASGVGVVVDGGVAMSFVATRGNYDCFDCFGRPSGNFTFTSMFTAAAGESD